MTIWTRPRDPTYYTWEKQVMKAAASAYPRYDFEKRFATTIQQDPVYVAAVLGAALVAFLAGSGFGRLQIASTGPGAYIYAIAAAGIVCALAWRQAIYIRVGSKESRNALAQAFLVGLVAAFLLVPRWLQGQFDAWYAMIVCGAAVATWGLLGFNLPTRVPSYLLIGLCCPLTLSRFTPPNDDLRSMLTFLLGLLILGIICAGSWWFGKVRIQPAGILVQFAAVFVLCAALHGKLVGEGPELVGVFTSPAGILAAILVVAWYRLSGQCDWSVMALGVVLIHLGGVLFAPSLVFVTLAEHLAALLVEFALVFVAAVRIWQLRAASLPPGNFLNQPQAYIPSLTQSRNFALESDVVD